MGSFDQAARYATEAEPSAVVGRLFRPHGDGFAFRAWLETKSLALPGPERSADRVALLERSTEPQRPWLLVLEFQSQPDEDKLWVTLEETATLASRARHGPDRIGRYAAIAALVYLVGACPQQTIDMRLDDGPGTRHEVLCWNIADDDAAETLERVAAGTDTWGMLFWVPLMRGSTSESVLERWRELVLTHVAGPSQRGDIAGIARVFAELAGCRPERERGLEGFNVVESQVVREWMMETEERARLEELRKTLLRNVRRKFGVTVPDEIRGLIEAQPSLALLRDWVDAAFDAASFEEFVAVLRR